MNTPVNALDVIARAYDEIDVETENGAELRADLERLSAAVAELIEAVKEFRAAEQSARHALPGCIEITCKRLADAQVRLDTALARIGGAA